MGKSLAQVQEESASEDHANKSHVSYLAAEAQFYAMEEPGGALEHIPSEMRH